MTSQALNIAISFHEFFGNIQTIVYGYRLSVFIENLRRKKKRFRKGLGQQEGRGCGGGGGEEGRGGGMGGIAEGGGQTAVDRQGSKDWDRA